MKYSKERLIGSGMSLKREDFIFFWGHTAHEEVEKLEVKIIS